jgi:hypothetical protein
MSYQTKSPVLLIAFNSKERVAKVLDVIKVVRPSDLFVAVDGARDSVQGESQVCAEVMSLIEAAVDWPCSFHLRASKLNKGSHAHIPEAVDWFFENVSFGIVLEDDCVPSISFFEYCDSVCTAYGINNSVMWINGTNCGYRSENGSSAFGYYTKYPISWGWASWRDCWAELRKDISARSPSLSMRQISSNVQGGIMATLFWAANFRYCYAVRNWDFRVTHALWRLGGMALSPPINLVSNIGNDAQAYHGGSRLDGRFNIPSGEWHASDALPMISAPGDFDAFIEDTFYRVALVRIVKLAFIARFPYLRRVYRALSSKAS